MKASIDRLIISSPYEEPWHYWSYDRESRYSMMNGPIRSTGDMRTWYSGRPCKGHIGRGFAKIAELSPLTPSLSPKGARGPAGKRMEKNKNIAIRLTVEGMT